MSDKQIENRIAKAVSAAVPNVYDRVASENIVKQTNHDFITAQPKKEKRTRLAAIRAAASAVASLVIVMALVAVFSSYLRVASVVGLDVNPSIELRVNSRDRVIAAEALNADGAAILYGMELKRVDLTVAVNAVVGSMLRNGYLSSGDSAILVTVSSRDEAGAARLESALADDLNGLFSDSDSKPHVLHQTISGVAPSTEGISAGRARLIELASAANPSLTAEELADMDLYELYTAAASAAGTDIEDGSIGAIMDAITPAEPTAAAEPPVAPTVTAAPTVMLAPIVTAEPPVAPIVTPAPTLIGEDAASRIALERAGGGTVTDVELDEDDGLTVYEVELRYEGLPYECEINAYTGAVISFERD